MTILFFNTFYYPKQVGGAEISVQLMAERLVKAGHRVFVITSGNRKTINHRNGVVIIRIKQRNVFSTYSNSRRKGRAVKTIWHIWDSCNPLNFFLISGILKRVKPDVVHTNNIQGFSPFIWAIVKFHGLRLIHTLRDYYLLCHRNTLYQKDIPCESLCWSCKITYHIKKNFSRYPDCYVGISNFVLDKHVARLPMEKQRKVVIYNVVDAPAQPSRRINGGKELVFGFIGRLTTAKGVVYLAREIAAMNTLLRDDFKVVFAGTGDPEMIGHLQQILKGVRFEFPGFVEPASFFNEIDLLIVPSLWDEPFGRIVIESLSYEIPVCLARSGGLNELHRPDCTWSFDPAPGVLCELLEAILRHKHEIQQKREGCRRSAAQFAPDHHDRQYLALYNEKRTNVASP